MRLWTLHPKYLDSRGLVALWREALLAQKVIAGETRGYRSHPQLWRFRAHSRPPEAIAAFLRGIVDEAVNRGYRFDQTKIAQAPAQVVLEASSDQLLFEWEHLLIKLRRRAPSLAEKHSAVDFPIAHPLFRVKPGPIAEWEVRPG